MGGDCRACALTLRILTSHRGARLLTLFFPLHNIVGPCVLQGPSQFVCAQYGENEAPGPSVMTTTYSPKAGEVERRWYVVDASEMPLGRLASRVATLLTGKHKPVYARHLDTGDFVIVVNAEKARLTGRKEEAKVYYRHSGRPGGLKTETVAEVRRRYPVRLVERAVRGMLPRGPLGRRQFRKLKVYAGPDHPHAAQKPESLSLSSSA